MKNKNQHIEQFPLTPNAKAGVFIRNMKGNNSEEHDISKPHRDNHCQLMLATEGSFKLNIDFKNVEFNAPALICVFPEQVHYIIEVDSPKGWIINFDPSLVDKELLQLMENKMNAPLPLEPTANLFHQATTLMALIEKLQSENTNKFVHKASHSLLNGLLNLIIGEIMTGSSSQNQKTSRGIILKDTFGQLLKQHFKTWKQPAQYAAALAISAAHLNDTVKALTGNPISIHIQETSILEAKRLLYFTDNSVKEIAHEVGYDEPVYFGKLFKKLTNMTPLEFRKQFRD
ncbi:MAG: AraC family transcriptional regulator [Flavobacterium circumlabens]|uniref:AraC family transcriptional regulator n=1 Tax=Flavobacterium circumlabens TaxID=2133765 RepID=UPI003263CD94